MAFEKIEVDRCERSEDYEYLLSISYIDVLGNIVKEQSFSYSYYKDKERDIFIISNSNDFQDYSVFEGKYNDAYVICINKNPIGVLVEEKSKGNMYNGDYECKWIIKKVVYPKNQNATDYPNIKEIIEESFTAATLLQTYYPKGLKGVTVEFMCDNV